MLGLIRVFSLITKYYLAELKPEYNCKIDLSSGDLNPCVLMWLENVLNKLNLLCELLLLEHLHPLFILVLQRKWISATIFDHITQNYVQVYCLI